MLGHRGNFGVLAERAANWEDALRAQVDVPPSDFVGADDRVGLFAGARRLTPLLPEDVLAAAFHGLAARRMRGAPRRGEDVATFAENLRGLADALTTFNNYRPGTFLDLQVMDELAAKRRPATQRRRRAPAADAHEADDE